MNPLTLISARALLIISLGASLPSLAQPEAGPESGGLQMQLVVKSRKDKTKEGYDVELNIVNTTRTNITLGAIWSSEHQKGDLKEFVEAAASIETYPVIGTPGSQVGILPRTSPQPNYVLKGGKMLSLHWATDGRHLKNKVADAITAQNPEFPFPGMYSVRAILKVNASGNPVLLRSNEQLVSVGGSRELPKHTCGQLGVVRPKERTADLNLGKIHKIQLGDEFEIRTGMADFWKFTVTMVGDSYSRGSIEPLLKLGRNSMSPDPIPPQSNQTAMLILKNK